MLLSLPPVTNRRRLPGPGFALIIDPAEEDGAQLIEFTPIPWAWKISCFQLLSLNSKIETCPSDEAVASRQPLSCGAQDIMFTDAMCAVYSKTRDQVLVEAAEVEVGACSRQIKTLPSWEDEARIVPYLGCACVAPVNILVGAKQRSYEPMRHTTQAHHAWTIWMSTVQRRPQMGERAHVPLQRLDKTMRISFDFEYLDCLVGRAGRQSATIVVQ